MSGARREVSDKIEGPRTLELLERTVRGRHPALVGGEGGKAEKPFFKAKSVNEWTLSVRL
jgi:hypothetical protein